jgi:uncharacterized PurR-regulated membrane protein YhhQ (DUF165 family)
MFKLPIHWLFFFCAVILNLFMALQVTFPASIVYWGTVAFLGLFFIFHAFAEWNDPINRMNRKKK